MSFTANNVVQERHIVLVDFPFSDDRSSKLRPALVISSEAVHSTGDLMLMMITSKEKHDGLNIAIAPEDLTKPLPLKSYLRCHKIFILRSDLVVRELSRLNKDCYAEAVNLLYAIVK